MMRIFLVEVRLLLERAKQNGEWFAERFVTEVRQPALLARLRDENIEVEAQGVHPSTIAAD